MSGAHCIDFYNKSTLTFIVLHVCFSSCFLLHCHLLKTSAESFAAPVHSSRVLVRWVRIPRSALVVAQVKLHPLEPCSTCAGCASGRGSGRGAPAAPGLTAWIVVPAGLQFLLAVMHEQTGRLAPSCPNSSRLGVDGAGSHRWDNSLTASECTLS